MRISCQEESFDPDAYPKLVRNYRADLNRLLSNYKPSWSFHSKSSDFNTTQIEGQGFSRPCMICDNPHKPEFNSCRYCSDSMCYCRCNLCKTCYCTCQLCEGPHPTSMCISDSDSSENDPHNSENDFNNSISSGCHTDSNPENSIEYSNFI